MLIYSVFFYFFVIIRILFPTQAMEGTPEEIQMHQIQKDAGILQRILKKNDGNSTICDKDYGEIADRMIASVCAQIPAEQSTLYNYNLGKVIELYEGDKESGRLNGVRLTWLGIQLAMAVTPPLKKLTLHFKDEDCEFVDVKDTPALQLMKDGTFRLFGRQRNGLISDPIDPTTLKKNYYLLKPQLNTLWNKRKGFQCLEENFLKAILKEGLHVIPQSEKSIYGLPTDAFINHLKSKIKIIKGVKTPFWLWDFEILEENEKENNSESPYSLTKICHLFAQPLPVYQGNSGFSPKASLLMAQHGIFLYSVNSLRGAGHIVHGGLLRTPAERTIHDIIHYHSQWLQPSTSVNYGNFHDFSSKLGLVQSFHEAHTAWKEMFKTICALLDHPDLSIKAKSKLEVVSFMIQHELDSHEIPSIFKLFDKLPTGIELMRKAIELSIEDIEDFLNKPDNKEEFYKDYCLNSINLQKGRSQETKEKLYQNIKGLKIEEDPQHLYHAQLSCQFNMHQRGREDFVDQKITAYRMNHYCYWKTFFRDLGHLLINKGLWNPENQKLGTTYSISEVRENLIETHKWALKNLAAGKKLYQILHS